VKGEKIIFYRASTAKYYWGQLNKHFAFYKSLDLTVRRYSSRIAGRLLLLRTNTEGRSCGASRGEMTLFTYQCVILNDMTSLGEIGSTSIVFVCIARSLIPRSKAWRTSLLCYMLSDVGPLVPLRRQCRIHAKSTPPAHCHHPIS
jgi:hypothetical protein